MLGEIAVRASQELGEGEAEWFLRSPYQYFSKRRAK